jgi:hypothetical protein
VASEAETLATRHDGDVVDVYHAALRGFAVRMTDADAENLAREPDVASVEEDGFVHAQAVQAIGTGDSWGLDRIDQVSLPLNGTYTYQATAGLVHAYIIDTSISLTEPDLGGRATLGVDEVGGPACSNGATSHGTQVAGIIGGARFGVAKAVQMVSVRVLDCSETGTVSNVVSGIDWVTANAVKPAVANLSLAGATSPTLDSAVEQSVGAGITYAVAAGNSTADACNDSPADATGVMTVGATGVTDALASFSNFGSCVDIDAPGVGVTTDGSPSGGSTGTSFSTAFVTGVAALDLGASPCATPAQVASDITTHASPGLTPDPGGGPPKPLLFSGFVGANAPPGSPCTPPIVTPPANATSPPVPASGSGTFDGFVRGGDNQLWWTRSTNGVWAAYSPLGGYLTSDAAVASDASGAWVFVRGLDNALYYRRFDGTSWTPSWISLGGYVTSNPTAVSTPSGPRVFVRGFDNALYTGAFTGTAFSGWTSLGGLVTSNTAAAAWDGSGVRVFVGGFDHAVYTGRYAQGWSGWTSLGGTITSDPAAVFDGVRVWVFARGNNNNLFVGSSIAPNLTGFGWVGLGGTLTERPAAAIAESGSVRVFVRGPDNSIYTRSTLDNWGPGYENLGGTATTAPSAAGNSAGAVVLVRGPDQSLYSGSHQSGWHGWTTLGGTATTNPTITASP